MGELPFDQSMVHDESSVIAGSDTLWRWAESKLLVCLTGTFGYGKRCDMLGKEIMHNFAKRAPVGDNKSFLPKVLDSSSLLYIKPRVIWYLDVPIFCNFPFASLVSPPSSSSTFFFSVQKWNGMICFASACDVTLLVANVPLKVIGWTGARGWFWGWSTLLCNSIWHAALGWFSLRKCPDLHLFREHYIFLIQRTLCP